MRFTLQTLTPLHTGGIRTGQMDRIHETGIIGSLRWWYEAVLRGLVGTDDVCDPTGDSDRRCNYEKHKWVCRACDLFGATGWKRRFRLEVNGGGALFTSPPRINIKIGTNSWNNGWHFQAPYISDSARPINGTFTVLRDRAPGHSSVENDLRVIVALINKWGAMGAKTQHGFGVAGLKFDDDTQPDIEAFLSDLTDSTSDHGLPALGNMFFARLNLKDGVHDNWWKIDSLGRGVRDEAAAWKLEDSPKARTVFSVPIAPAVKYKLRFGKNGTSCLSEAAKCEKYFFGTVKPSQKAKLNISNAYKNAEGIWEFRIWGWFPEEHYPTGVSRSQLIKELHELVTDSAKHQGFWDGVLGDGVVDLSKSVWRERDSTGHGRNTTGCSATPNSCANYMHCLLP